MKTRLSKLADFVLNELSKNIFLKIDEEILNSFQTDIDTFLYKLIDDLPDYAYELYLLKNQELKIKDENENLKTQNNIKLFVLLLLIFVLIKISQMLQEKDLFFWYSKEDSNMGVSTGSVNKQIIISSKKDESQKQKDSSTQQETRSENIEKMDIFIIIFKLLLKARILDIVSDLLTKNHLKGLKNKMTCDEISDAVRAEFGVKITKQNISTALSNVARVINKLKELISTKINNNEYRQNS